MGWSCYLTTDRKISEEDVEKILLTVPEHLSNTFFKTISKQSWGWSSTVDIYKPSINDERRLIFGGSYGMSGNIAEEYVEWFSNELIKLGYEIKLKEFNW